MAEKKQWSYVCTPYNSPLIYQVVPDRLRHLAAEDPDRDAFIYYDLNRQRTSITRQQLLDQSTNAAKNFIKSGMRKGQSVAICMSNSLEMLVTNMGVILAGGVPFYVSTNLKDGSDLLEFVNNLEARFLFLDTNDGDENWKILEIIWPIGDNSSKKAPSLEMVICNGKIDGETDTRKNLASFLERTADDNIALPTLQPEDTLLYFCTSGSTGKPKEVIYTHFGTINWTKMADNSSNIREDSIYFCDRSFSWAVGFPRSYLTEGSTRVFVDSKLSTAGKHTDYIGYIIKTEQCDVVYLPGYMVVDMLNNPDMAKNYAKVKTIYMSGEKVPYANYEATKSKLCDDVRVLYGTTESGMTSSFNSATDGEFEDGMIGKPFPGVEMKVIDDAGEVVPIGSHGELCIRCVWRFAGYRNMEELFHAAVDNRGWFHTGDIAHMREDGNFIVDGRKKEIISSGTNKYFPWIIERALKNIKGAKNVFAVGVPDTRLGQVVCACVLPKQGVSITETDVKLYCDETFLEESTIFGVSVKPRYYIILDNVPLTTTGKINRKAIGLLAKERLGL